MGHRGPDVEIFHILGSEFLMLASLQMPIADKAKDLAVIWIMAMDPEIGFRPDMIAVHHQIGTFAFFADIHLLGQDPDVPLSASQE